MSTYAAESRRFPAFALLFASLIPARPASAQRWTLPEPVQARVDSVFAFVGRDAPGCALGVVQQGRITYGRGYGLANLDWRIPITTTTVFDIGSTSKQFTATAVALLAGDGVLSLDDDVRRWIPEMPEYGTTITLRHLLNHTSGVRDYLTLLSLAGFEFANVFDEEDGVRLIARQRALNFDPGAEFLYSNSGYLLLAAVVRRASGQSLRRFLEARVFDPLGMAHTSIWDDNTEILAARATGYAPSEGGGWEIDHAWNFQMGGDGQVITSVEDLARWDANFYQPTVGGQALLDRLHTRGILNDGDTIPYALGLTLDAYRGLRRVQHGGAWAGFRAMLMRFPDQHTSIVIECNRGDANTTAYANAVVDAVLADAFPEAAGTPAGPAAVRPAAAAGPAVAASAERVARWVGAYRLAERPEYLFFEAREGDLWLASGAGVRLEALSDTTFRVPSGGTLFVFASSPGGMHVTARGARWDRVASAPLPYLSELVGSYASPELDAVFEIVSDADRLTLRRPNAEPVTLRPGRTDEWVALGSTLTFTRDAGRVTGFRVWAGRVTGIVFERTGG